MEPLTRRIWLSQLWQHLHCLVSCRNGSALLIKVLSQHFSAADTAQSACSRRAWNLWLPGGSVIETINLRHSGWNLLCTSSLPFCIGTSIRKGLGFHCPVLSPWLLFLTCCLLLKGLTSILKSLSKNSCRIHEGRVVACPYGSIALQQRDTEVSTATRTGLLLLCSSAGKKKLCKAATLCVDELEWVDCLLSYFIIFLRRVICALSNVWQFATHLQQ